MCMQSGLLRNRRLGKILIKVFPFSILSVIKNIFYITNLNTGMSAKSQRIIFVPVKVVICGKYINLNKITKI